MRGGPPASSWNTGLSVFGRLVVRGSTGRRPRARAPPSLRGQRSFGQRRRPRGICVPPSLRPPRYIDSPADVVIDPSTADHLRKRDTTGVASAAMTLFPDRSLGLAPASVRRLPRAGPAAAPPPAVRLHRRRRLRASPRCAANVDDLAAIHLRQRVLRDVSELQLATTVLGQSLAMPVVLGPVGLAGMFATPGRGPGGPAAEAAGHRLLRVDRVHLQHRGGGRPPAPGRSGSSSTSCATVPTPRT